MAVAREVGVGATPTSRQVAESSICLHRRFQEVVRRLRPEIAMMAVNVFHRRDHRLQTRMCTLRPNSQCVTIFEMNEIIPHNFRPEWLTKIGEL